MPHDFPATHLTDCTMPQDFPATHLTHCTMPQDFPATHLTWLLITPSTYLSANLPSNPLFVRPQVSISHPHPAKMDPIPLHTMKAYGVIRVWPHTSVTSELDWGEWQATSSDRFTPKESVTGNHRVAPDSIVMILEKRKWKRLLHFTTNG
jgi:hypothetical protein